MKMFQISDKIDNVSRIGIGCMRITGLSDEKAVRSLNEVDKMRSSQLANTSSPEIQER